jgi:uncharacterized RDD family membrane protein YckC
MWWVMNAIAHASAAPTTGPKLDNRRVLAAIVDLAIVVAGSLVILFAADALSSDTGDVRGALSAVILGWALYYYFALESGDGQTLGKKLMKLRVVRADGRPAGMNEIAVRTVLRVVDGIGLYIVGLIVMLATGQRRQRLGDMAAGTIIVDASAPATMPPAPVAAPVDEAPVDEAPTEDEPETPSASTITLPSRPAAPATLDDLSKSEAPPVPEMRPFDPPQAEDEPELVAEEPEPVEEEPVADVVEDEPAFQAPEPIESEPVFEAAEPVEDEPLTDESVADEPLEDEPVAGQPILGEAVVDEPIADEPVADEPVVEEPLPDLSTPAIEELAHDVEAARSEPVPVHRTEDEPAADEGADDDPADDEPITLKSVETVSAIDLVMGGAPEEDDSPEPDQDPEPPAAS